MIQKALRRLRVMMLEAFVKSHEAGYYNSHLYQEIKTTVKMTGATMHEEKLYNYTIMRKDQSQPFELVQSDGDGRYYVLCSTFWVHVDGHLLHVAVQGNTFCLRTHEDYINQETSYNTGHTLQDFVKTYRLFLK